MDSIRHEHCAHWNQSAAQSFRKHHNVRTDAKMVRPQKRAGAKHPGLYFVGNEKGSVAPAQILRPSKVVRLRDANAAFRLDGFYKESGIALGRQFLFKSREIAEWHRYGFRQQRPETLTPILTVHQG